MRRYLVNALALWLFLLLPGSLFVYILVVQPWYMRWGATDAEIAMAHQSPLVMAGLGATVAALLAGMLQLLVQRSLGSYFAALWPTSYFFWLGLPSLLFVGATVWIGWRMGDDSVGRHAYRVRAVS